MSPGRQILGFLVYYGSVMKEQETDTFTVTYQPTNGGEFSITVGSTGKYVCMALNNAQQFLDDMLPIPDDEDEVRSA